MQAKSAAPTAKVAAGGIAGAITVILIFILPKIGIKAPDDVASAMATLGVAAGAAYLKKEELGSFNLTDEKLLELARKRGLVSDGDQQGQE